MDQDRPSPSRSSAFAIYLTGLGSWFIPLGIQQVLFAWLAAIVLHMDAFAVGIAQVALMAPGILFLPLGGLVADRGNPRRLLLRYHFLYAVPPLVLAGVLSMGGLSYPLLIAYGLAAGSIGAFAVPTRDALLPTVAAGNLARAVALATALQFFGQLIGIAAASQADRIGALPLLLAQAALVLAGAIAVWRLPEPKPVLATKMPVLGSRDEEFMEDWWRDAWGEYAEFERYRPEGEHGFIGDF